MSEALDRCLARMRRGESLEHCLADYADLADEIRPLLLLANDINASVMRPAKAHEALARGREQFLTAAARAFALADGDGAVTGEASALADALDEGVSALRDGSPADQTLSAHPDLADGLGPLLATAGAMSKSIISPPPPPTHLARGRDRLLVAAADLREQSAAAAAQADGDASLSDALDACLTGIRAGASIEAVLGEHPHQAEALRPLLVAAAEAHADVVVPPQADLARGRARMLTVAAERRAASPSESVVARLSGWLGLGQPLSIPQMVTAAAAVLLFLIASGPAVTRATADALPGDTLYGVKRVNEQILLALTFDPNSRADREAEYSQRRADELGQVIDQQRQAEIARWSVRFRGYEEQRPSTDQPWLGLLFVVTLGDEGETKTLKLRLDADSKVDFGGRYGSWDEVPPGTRLVIHVEIPEGDEPRLLSARLASVAEPESTATSESSPTATVPATTPPQRTPTVPTETPGVTATITPTRAIATLTLEPTETLAPTPTATLAVGVSGEKPTRSRLRGVLLDKVDDVTWIVRAEADDRRAEVPGDDVRVDMSRIDAGKRDQVPTGSWVELHGRYLNDTRTRFEATGLDRFEANGGESPMPGREQCTSANTTSGQVKAYEAGQSLTLFDDTVYVLTELAPENIDGALEVGVRVTIDYLLCQDGTRKATAIQVLGQRRENVYPQGTVRDLSGGRFTLVTRQGTEYPILIGDETQIVGAPELSEGQTVLVRGWEDDNGDVHATRIQVRVVETPTPDATDTPVATPTDTPAPTLTPTTVLESSGATTEPPSLPTFSPAPTLEAPPGSVP